MMLRLCPLTAAQAAALRRLALYTQAQTWMHQAEATQTADALDGGMENAIIRKLNWTENSSFFFNKKVLFNQSVSFNAKVPVSN